MNEQSASPPPQTAAAQRPQVALVYPEHDAQVAYALGRAFINDPPFVAILRHVPDPAERAERLRQLFAVVLGIHRGRGLPVFGLVADGKVVAAAIFEGTQRATTWQFLKLGFQRMPRMIAAAGVGGTTRALRMLDGLERLHPAQPHLYLAMLGVDPDYQKRHFGVALIQHLEREAHGRPDVCGVYLETATMANVAFYQRAGYEVVGETDILGVHGWRMLQARR